MSVLTAVKAWLRPYDQNERMLTPSQVWGRGGIWQPLSTSGIAVTAEMAMQSAVGACIRLLADDISSLPVDVYRKVDGETVPSNRPSWLEYPTGRRWDTFQAHLSDVVVSMLMDGGAFIECTPDTMSPRLFSVKDPSQWVIKVDADGAMVFDGPGGRRLTEMQMAYIPWIRMPGALRGLNVLDASRESTGLELAARQWASAFFANGGTLGTIIQHPGKPSAEEMDILRSSFEKRHVGSASAFKMGVLTGGAAIVDGTIKPQEASLEPLWKHVLEEAARLFHIPPHLLGSQETGTSSYASVEQKSIEYVQHAVVPVTTRIEAAYGRFLGRDRFIKLNTNALMRADIKTRAEWYTVALQNKVMLREEVRAKEDLPSLGPLGWLETPNNNAAEEPTEETPDEEPADEAASIVISDVHLRDEAAAQLTERVTEAIVVGREQASTDLAQMHTDLLSKTDRDMAELREQLRALQAEAEARREAERVASLAPVSRKVIRDENGRISGVIEQQGERMVRKVIERDERGAVITVTEVAA